MIYKDEDFIVYKLNGTDEEGYIVNEYEISKKIDNQKVVVSFKRDDNDHADITYYSIVLKIINKKKQKTYLKSTGKCGLKGLLFAKEAIIFFEKYVIEKQYYTKHCFILCFWDDNRRRDIYYRSLKKIGYDYKMMFGKKIIVKKII